MTLSSTSCLFPQVLREELREVNRVVEQYSNTHPLRDSELGTATGLALGATPLTVRVKTPLGISQYLIEGYM